MEFRPVTPAARALFESRSSVAVRNCDAAFANIFCWQDSYRTLFAEACGFLVVRYQVEGAGSPAYMLFGSGFSAGNLQELVSALEEDARSQGYPLRITGIPESVIPLFRDTFGDRFACAASRDAADYIYKAEALRTLSGRKYQSKRNHLNRFNELYDWVCEPLTAAHREECLRLDAAWQSHHGADGGDTIDAERRAIVRAFDNFDSLGLSGCVIRIGGEVAAFTYGSAVSCETFVVHVEKADTSFEGIFPAINRLFAESLPPQYRYINREEDMGIEGLRRSKLSYHPSALEYKWTALSLSGTERSMARLWYEAFGDEREFVDRFLVDREFYNVKSFAAAAGERIVSMLHLVPFEDSDGRRIAYIYGVATDKTCRRQGLATKLLRDALTFAGGRFDAVVLIPSGDEVKSLYRRAGFVETQTVVEFDTEFDFGSGDPARDRAMVLALGNAVVASPLRLRRSLRSIAEPVTATE